jgi:hypothetical protein
MIIVGKIWANIQCTFCYQSCFSGKYLSFTSDASMAIDIHAEWGKK